MKKLKIMLAAIFLTLLYWYWGPSFAGDQPKSSPVPNTSKTAESKSELLKRLIDKKIGAIDEKLEELNTAILLCKRYICKETMEGRFVYQSQNKKFWFYPNGEVIDINKVDLKN